MRIGKPLRAPRNGLEAMFMSPGPSVTVLPRVAKPFAKSSIARDLDYQISRLRSRIETVMPMPGGVIVRIVVHEAKAEREDGRPADQRLLAVEIVGAGRIAANAATVAVAGMQPPKRAPRGWLAKSLYLWVTR